LPEGLDRHAGALDRVLDPPAAARVCFLYIAQGHQLFHSLSVAVELARRHPDVLVEIAATKEETLDYARLLVARLGSAPIGWRLLGPRWLRHLEMGDAVPPKVPMLAANIGVLRSYDAIVTPERTTAVLRRMGVMRPKLVYTQHGAGDRAGPFEPRLRIFDLVFAAGAKQRDRMVEEGLVEPSHCAVVGYPKFDLVDALDPPLPRLFGEPRPIVLYTPHFDRRLSSWFAWGPEVLDAFARQDRYNLVFAPHVRLFAGRPAREIEPLARFLGNPAIHIETGCGTAAIDMTFTRMADVYLGDVSSQVYEFIRTPRPCLFLNASGADWHGSESYRHWRFGPVLDTPDRILDEVDHARATHGAYAAEQVAGFRHTFDVSDEPASRRAAQAIARLVTGIPANFNGCGAPRPSEPR